MRPRFPSSYIMLSHESRRRIPKQHANGTKQSKFLTRETIIYRCSGARIPPLSAPLRFLKNVGNGLGHDRSSALGCFRFRKIRAAMEMAAKKHSSIEPPSPVRSLCSIYSGRFLISTCPRKRPELVSRQDVITLSRTLERG